MAEICMELDGSSQKLNILKRQKLDLENEIRDRNKENIELLDTTHSNKSEIIKLQHARDQLEYIYIYIYVNCIAGQ